MITETLDYAIELSRLRINRPAKCCRCGQFVGQHNLAGREGYKRFVCRRCQAKNQGRR